MLPTESVVHLLSFAEVHNDEKDSLKIHDMMNKL